jgi:hypothetical protein
MSYFYKYNFTSPEPIYAIVKEELKSYFDTGAVDDLLFPVYTNKCLEKLGRSTHAIVPVVLFVEDFVARLPENFYAIREAWYCNWVDPSPHSVGNAFYSQAYDTSTIQLTPTVTNQVNPCDNPGCVVSDCGGECLSSVVQGVYKTLREIPRTSFRRQFLLKPGNISFSDDCDYNYNNSSELYGNISKPASPVSAHADSFDLHDNKFVTTFRKGVVEILMYASDYDNLGNQMIPENYRIKEYIEAFIKYKVFETLTNQTNDETFKQLQQKMLMYKQMSDEAYILAETEIKKQTVYEKQRRISKTAKRFDKYEIATGRGRYGRRYGRRRRNY